MARSINWLQVCAAVLIGLLGVYVIVQGSGYEIGSLRRMGPGFFPIIIGSALLLFAVLLLLEVWHSEKEKAFWIPRPLLTICAGFIAFGVLLDRAGLVPATLAMVILVSFAEKPVRPVATLATAVGLSVVGVVVFIHGFGLPLEAFTW